MTARYDGRRTRRRPEGNRRIHHKRLAAMRDRPPDLQTEGPPRRHNAVGPDQKVFGTAGEDTLLGGHGQARSRLLAHPPASGNELRQERPVQHIYGPLAYFPAKLAAELDWGAELDKLLATYSGNDPSVVRRVRGHRFSPAANLFEVAV